MLVKNDAKGSFGAFSNLGRATVNTFVNIKNKDLILNPEKYKNNKDSIIKFLKRNKYNNIEGDESKELIKDDQNFEEESEIEEPIEDHDIFDINEEEEENNKKNKEKNKNINSNNIFHKTNNEAYKYHDMNMNKKRIKKNFYTPNCTKYVPKKDFVWNRMPTCLKWDTMPKRKPLYIHLVDAHLLVHDDPLKNIQKCFVNMDKQTMRGDNNKFNNIRIQTAKPFNAEKNIKRKKHRNKKRMKTGTIRYANKKLSLDNNYINDINNNNNIFDLNKNKNIRQITTEMTDDTNKNNKNLNLNINTTSNNKSKSALEEEKNIYFDNDLIKKEEYLDESLSDDSYHKFKSHYAKQLKTNNIKTEVNVYKENKEPETQVNNYPIIKTEINDSKIINFDNKRPKTALDKKNIENKNKIKGPVFDKIIPREYYDNLNDNGIKLIPFAINNYNQVRERPITMVKYNTKKSFKKQLDFFKGIEVGQYLNTPINYIEHKNYVPIFKKMHTRPDDTDPLPIYMKGVVSRNACNMTSNISLKMNSYADGKTRGNYNTCNPKKSFNKIVNLNLMNYQDLKKYILMNKDLLLGLDDNYIIKSLRFYKRNYRDLLKETTTNFDNITFKTIKSKYEYNLNL